MHSERLRKNESVTVSDIYKLFPDYTPLSRLDYEADGVIGMVHKNIKVTSLLKSYYAVVSGDFPKEIKLSKKIMADNRKKVKVLEEDTGFLAVMKKIDFNGSESLIEVTLKKAARHQVRAFSAYLNHSILGDKLYNGREFKRLCLHCYKYSINGFDIYCKKQTDDFLNMYKTL